MNKTNLKINNGTMIIPNQNNNKHPFETSFMPTASSLSPHSPTTSSSSTTSSSKPTTNESSVTIFNDPNLKLNLISQLFKNNDLVLNCVQFVNLIDLYFEDDLNNNSCDEHRKTFDSVSFLYEWKKPNHNSNELKLPTDTSTTTTTCFPCIVCSSRFSFEQTFHLHLERRSILIRFYCVKCQAFKSFYNKCKLLYHVYSHKMFIFEPIYKSIKIETITLERLNLSKERNIDFSACISFNVSNEMDEMLNVTTTPLMLDLADSVFTNRSNRIQQNDNDHIKMFLKRLVQNKFLLFRCSICDALFFDLKELKLHYYKSQQHELDHLNVINANNNNNSNQLNRRYIFKNLKQRYTNSFNKNNFNFLNENTNKETLTSDKTTLFVNILNDLSLKKLQFSTRCSTLANMNLISSNYQFYLNVNPSLIYINTKNNRPLICPECGISFDAKTQFEKFRLHLIYECLFTSKYDCGQIKCSAFNCQYLAESANDFVAHWSKFHIKNEHQCDICDKKGLQFIFENETSSSSNHVNNIESNTIKNSQIFKNIIANEEDMDNDSNASNDCNVVNEPILSPNTISEINKHFFDKHRNLQVALKLVYRCSCKTSTNLNDDMSEQINGAKNTDCVHTTWKNCHKHIISLIAKTLASLNCLMCNKLVSNNEYQNHLKTVHNLDKICICPFCGVLKDEVSLQSHIFRVHHQLNLNEYPTSSFFNLITTLNKTLTTNQILNLNVGNVHNLFQSSPNIIPANFSVYQCLNCRLFFASNCKFSHNCWTYTELNKTASNKDSKQQSTNNNYFSPIYLKFNVNKGLFSKSNAISNVNKVSGDTMNGLVNSSATTAFINNNNKKLKISDYNTIDMSENN